MIVTSDFECGNGKDICKIGPRRYRITEDGDKVTYCYYFLIEVEAETEDEAGEVTLEIIGDPDLVDPEKGDVGTQGLMGHSPFAVWVSRWQEWRAIDQRMIDYQNDRVVIRVDAYQERVVRVTNVIPAYYTETVEFLKACAARVPEHAEFIEVGETAEGRGMPGVRVTDGLKAGDRPRFLIFSGQHPIEFPGVWGTRGIADFLTTSIAEAEELRNEFEFVVIPLVNPDGTVHGRNNFNSLGQDLNRGFTGAFEGAKLAAN